MELTTGAILRRITRTELSVSAHKLATLILDGIAWTDGYNGLPRGTAAFALADLARLMGISRQHLHTLLAELATSSLRLIRHRRMGRSASWLFSFGCCDTPTNATEMSSTRDTPLYKEDSHKTVFSGTIMLKRSQVTEMARWLPLIVSAKATLPCRTADSRHIWDRFRAFNHRRGHEAVPAGYLLGFMRRWRAAGARSSNDPNSTHVRALSEKERELQQLVALAPIANRQFHENDLRKAIGPERYLHRLEEIRANYGCSGFVAQLAVHGAAVQAREIRR